jgi:hypothetical protein
VTWTRLALFGGACLLAAAAAVLGAPTAQACVTCQCGTAPPASECVGCDEPGTFFGGAEWTFQGTSEGRAGVDEVAVDSHVLGLTLGWVPVPRVRLALAMPLVHRHAELVSGQDHVGVGFGDLTLGGQFRLGTGPLAGLSLVAAVRFPTAPELETDEGEALELDAQVGTGAFVGFAGLQWGERYGSWSPSARAVAFVPSSSRFGFEPAPGVLFHAGAEYEALDWLALGLGLDGRYEGVETSEGAGGIEVDEPNSGGTVLFVSPGARVALTDGLELVVEGRLPVVSALRGAQWEGPIVAAGLSFRVAPEPTPQRDYVAQGRRFRRHAEARPGGG